MSTTETQFDYEKSLKKVASYPFIHKYLPFDRFVVRPPASLIVKAVFKTGITPNQLTVTSFLFSLLAAAAYYGGRYPYFVLGGCLSMVSTIFDAADGMLARTKGLTSRYGAYLDLFLDRIADFAVMVGISFGFARSSGRPGFLAFGLLTTALYFLQLNLYYINNLYGRAEKNGEGAEAKSLTVSGLFALSIAGRPDIFIVALFIVFVPSVIIKLGRFLAKGRTPAAPAA